MNEPIKRVYQKRIKGLEQENRALEIKLKEAMAREGEAEKKALEFHRIANDFGNRVEDAEAREGEYLQMFDIIADRLGTSMEDDIRTICNRMAKRPRPAILDRLERMEKENDELKAREGELTALLEHIEIYIPSQLVFGTGLSKAVIKQVLSRPRPAILDRMEELEQDKKILSNKLKTERDYQGQLASANERMEQALLEIAEHGSPVIAKIARKALGRSDSE